MATRVERRRRSTLIHEGWASGHLRPLDIRKGDNVEVISGKNKGKRGVVERILPDQQRIAVSGVNILKRHTKSGVQGNIQGGIVDFDGPVAYSNVMLVCNRCDKRTRIAHTVNELGRRVIVCKKCGETYERAQV
ncbi:MAG: 50S ribosomal protein L24 [Candidatus Dormiibacterota bacterium]